MVVSIDRLLATAGASRVAHCRDVASMGRVAAADASRLFDTRTRAAILLLGFASGLPAELIGGTFQTRLSAAGLKPGEIGMLGLVGLPLMLKPLWAPAVDRWVPPLGRRRGWIALAILAMVPALAGLGWIDPATSLPAVIACAVAVAVASATLDLAVNGYTCDAVDERSSAAGAGLSVWGWRAAAIASSWGALAVAQHLGWGWSYVAMAACAAVVLVALLWTREPEPRGEQPATLGDAMLTPLRAFWRDLGPLTLLIVFAFALLFRLPDSWAGNQTGVFLKELHFDLASIGFARGPVALVASGVGVLIAGWMGIRWSVATCLWVAGLAGMLSNLGFVALDHGWLRGDGGLAATIAIEAACGGLLSAVFVGFLMRLCRSSCSATQYALLTAIGLLGKYLAAPAGYLAQHEGWTVFFLWSVAVGLPGLLLIPLVTRPKAATG